ncbi:M23 family metallopeptidase [Roseomonas sp. BN140053]|uniref:M23 family metallopeptidase n=1 Tax=Roseomonas sp. BN140053 TaxID=3391898 RepID=UPI0039EB2EFD
MIGRRAALALPGLLLGCAGETSRAAPSASAPAAAGATPAASLDIPASGLTQGGLAVGRAAPGTRLTLDGRAVPVSPEGIFALGFGRDAPAEAVLAVTFPGGRAEQRRLAIAPRHWNVQRINGLPEAQVTPGAPALARIQAEQRRLNEARRTSTAVPHYAAGLHWPARGRISGIYGSQRILNGQPRAAHLGLDIAGPVGTPIAAAAAGRVTLAEDLYFTGNTLLVEHGHGVTTLYAHLSRIDVSPGQEVSRGEPIALMGATGRATGPHLHLGLFWGATSLDPQPVLEG